ncbi:MAG: hypothetical protein WCT20_02105 [Candidatus Babeliales bacterium]
MKKIVCSILFATVLTGQYAFGACKKSSSKERHVSFNEVTQVRYIDEDSSVDAKKINTAYFLNFIRDLEEHDVSDEGLSQLSDLLEKGADINARDVKTGLTPLEMAHKRGWNRLANFILYQFDLEGIERKRLESANKIADEIWKREELRREAR